VGGGGLSRGKVGRKEVIWRFLKQIVTSPYLSLVLRVCVGGFFVYASLSKIPLPAQFAEAAAAYQVVPYFLVNLGSTLLPWGEFVTGLFMIIGLRTRATAILIGLQLVLFAFMVSAAMYWETATTCGCYDTVGEPIGWKKLVEHLVFFLFITQIFFYDRLFSFGRGGFRLNLKGATASTAGSRKVSP
jgi:putative oxidoreductase